MLSVNQRTTTSTCTGQQHRIPIMLFAYLMYSPAAVRAAYPTPHQCFNRSQPQPTLPRHEGEMKCAQFARKLKICILQSPACIPHTSQFRSVETTLSITSAGWMSDDLNLLPSIYEQHKTIEPSIYKTLATTSHPGSIRE